MRKNARKISPGTAAGVKKRKTKTDHLGILNEPTSKNSQHNILERNKVIRRFEFENRNLLLSVIFHFFLMYY